MVAHSLLKVISCSFFMIPTLQKIRQAETPAHLFLTKLNKFSLIARTSRYSKAAVTLVGSTKIKLLYILQINTQFFFFSVFDGQL